jgi:hypothetical protein
MAGNREQPGAPVGYSGKPVWQKLGLAPGKSLVVVDPPSDYATLTGADPVWLATRGDAASPDIVHLFVRSRAALDAPLVYWLPRIAAGGMCWVSWPKKSSALFRDLTEDGVRDAALPLGWVDVKVCAIDADWSGLKLLRRRSKS